MFGFIKRLFGTETDRKIQALKPYVAQINKIYRNLAALSHDELRAETDKLREKLKRGLQDLEQKISALQEEARQTIDIKEQHALYARIDACKSAYHERIEEILWKILPQTFAIVKETARRFKEEEEIVVTATEYDKFLAEQHDFVTIDGEKAYWSTSWDVCGELVRWQMLHYDVQLMGGIVLHQGKVAEMATGEGKTLVATLPVFLNALTKQGVHVITVNDYLAKRDTEWMGPIFQFHGISIACIEGTPVQSAKRKAAYNADVTYGTNHGFGFDYLYDNMALSLQQQVQRGYFFCLVDEVDSPLLDDSRTPLIVSGRTHVDDHEIYGQLNPRVKSLYQAQHRLVTQLLKDAKQKIEEKKIAEGRLSLFRAYRGLPTYPPLVAYLSERGIKKILAETEDYYLQENSKLMPEADEPLFFTIERKSNLIDLTDNGIRYLSQREDSKDFFVLSDLASQLAELEKSKQGDPKELDAKKEQIITDFGIKAARVHAVNQLLRAYTLYEKDKDYVIVGREIKIVGSETGRILKGRRYSEGLHQALEAKEGLPVAKSSQVYATITPPNQFRMYPKLAGMTASITPAAIEMRDVYGLEIVVIPTNKPVIRKDLPDRIYKTEREKSRAVVELVKKIHKTGQPVLIMTSSVDSSDRLRRLLKLPPGQVLNAKNHHLEASIIAKAGRVGAVTIATQMAGRGTDIKVTPEAEALGGLFLMITDISPTRRAHCQKQGRSARQGQPGVTLSLFSLEDPMILHWQYGALGKIVDRVWRKEGEVLTDKRISGIIVDIQKSKEHNDFAARKRALEFDNVLDRQRKAIYRRRNHALAQLRLQFDVMYAIYSTIKEALKIRRTNQESSRHNPLVDIFHLDEAEVTKILHKNPLKSALNILYQKVIQQQREREAKLMEQFCQKFSNIEDEQVKHAILGFKIKEQEFYVNLNIADVVETKGKAAIEAIQSAITLKVIDKFWTEHLQHMEALKESVRTAFYEQQDPILVYKQEAVSLFKSLMRNINRDIAECVYNLDIQLERLALREKAMEVESLELQAEKEGEEGSFVPKDIPSIAARDIGRNERISVRYLDGTQKEQVKFKLVEKDLLEGKCVMIQDEVSPEDQSDG